MTHSRENKTTRWRWQQFVLSLSVAMWTFVDSPSALLAQENTKYPTLPTGSGITQSTWEKWHAQNVEGWASYKIARVFHGEFLSSDEQRAAKNALTYYGWKRFKSGIGVSIGS